MRDFSYDFLGLTVKVLSTGCLKKTWTFFEIGITILFIKESFQNFVWLLQNDTPLLWRNILYIVLLQQEVTSK